MNNNKTFADLKEGDIIYSVCTDLPKLKVVELKIKRIVHESNTNNNYFVEYEENHVSSERIFSNNLKRDKCSVWRYVYWHTSMEAARKTIKEAIEYRIKKHERTIKESKRALENYKRELKEFT